MATENKQQNFFILLGLNPDASWDEARFEQVLASKISEWKRASTGIAARSREAQRNLALVPQIQEVMGDPDLRSAHARAAKEELAAKRTARRERCDTQLNIAQSRGFLFEKELQDLIRDFSDAYSEREIRARVTVEVRRNAPEHSQEQPVDRIIAEDITRVLERLGIESLYQLLALPPGTSRQELREAADRLHDEMSRRRPETPEVKDRKELAGYAMRIFDSEEFRRQYDENLRYRSLDALFKDLDPVVERVPGKTVYEPEIKLFLEKAAQLGFSEEIALERLQVHGMQRKWFLRLGPDPIDKNTRKQQNADALRLLLEHKQLYRADEFLGGLKSGEIADRQRYQKEIINGISKANELVKKAHSPFMSHEERIHHCRTALHFCADSQEAYGKLSGLLVAPRNLQVTVNDKAVALSWEPSPLQDVSYKVVRKDRYQPESDTDGLHLVTTSEHVYQDTHLETGVPAFYAVFTVCDEVVSIDGARLRHPVLLIAEVTNEEVRVDDKHVELSWQVPPNVYGVIVRRKEKIRPHSIQDGILLPLPENEMTQVVDCCVQSNITYYYGLYCQFRDHEGNIVNSRGKIISVTPEELPDVINFLNIERKLLANGFEVQISWEASTNGNRVLLLKSNQPIVFEQNKSISLFQLGRYGEIVPGEGNIRKDVWAQAGIRYYTPAIISRDMAYLGPSHRCVCGEDVTGLKCQKFGTALRLDWKWPEHCQEVLIYYGHENYPHPQSHEAITNTYRVTREEYDYFGYFEMSGMTGQNYYIVVAAFIEHKGEHITTAGDRLHVFFPRRMVIEYEIKQRWFGRRKRFLHLMTRTPGQLPPFRLVRQRHRVPLNKSDGEEFFRWTESIELVDEYSFPLPDVEVPSNTFVGLFLEDNAAYEFIDVLPPVKEKLRLS